VELVSTLQQHASQLPINYEIIVADDGSSLATTIEANRAINDYTNSGTRSIFESLLEGVIKPNSSILDTRCLRVSFYVSSNSSKPNDLPANELTWNYSYGELILRTLNSSFVGDGCVVLYGFGGGMAIKYYTNNNPSAWKIVTMT
jgi:glycosyltransferase involved in cell wall biosynthesis